MVNRIGKLRIGTHSKAASLEYVGGGHQQCLVKVSEGDQQVPGGHHTLRVSS